MKTAPLPLIACPHCGADRANIIHTLLPTGPGWYGECEVCSARSGVCASQEAAAEWWNRRAHGLDAEAEVERMLAHLEKDVLPVLVLAQRAEIARLRAEVEHATQTAGQMALARADYRAGYDAGRQDRARNQRDGDNPYSAGELYAGWNDGWLAMDEHIRLAEAEREVERLRALLRTLKEEHQENDAKLASLMGVLNNAREISAYRDRETSANNVGQAARYQGKSADLNPYPANDEAARTGWQRGWEEMDRHIKAEEYGRVMDELERLLVKVKGRNQ